MLSKTTEYAIRATLYVASQSKLDRKVGVAEIAENLNAPRHFIAKILQVLTKNRVLLSTKGPNGGFYWERHDPCVSVLDLIEIFDGTSLRMDCVLGLKTCSSANPCPMHDQFKSLRTELVELFRTTKVEELSETILFNQSKLQ